MNITRLYFYLLFIFLPVLFLFGDRIKLDLITAQNLALANNVEHHISQLKQQMMKRSYILGFTKFFPQFSTGFSLGNMLLYDINDYTTQLYRDPYRMKLTLGVDQLVFDGGEAISGAYFKYYEVNLMGKELEEKELFIRTEIEAMYSGIVFLKKRVEEQEKNIELLKKEQAITEKNLELELITKLDYKELKLQLLEAEINLATDIRKYDFALAEFKQLINVDAEVELTSELEIKLLEIPEKREEFFVQMTYMNNSKSNTLKLKEYKDRAKQVMTYLSLFPKVNMNFTYTFEGEEGNIFPLKKKGWQLGFDVNWNLPAFPVSIKPTIKYPLDNEKYQDAIDSSKYMLGEVDSVYDVKYLKDPESINKFQSANIDFYQSHLEHNKYVKDTSREIKQTIKEYNELIKLFSLNNQRIGLLEEKLVILKLKLELGDARLIDIIDSENKLFSARIQMIDLTNQIYNKIISIKNLTGISTEEFYEAVLS